MPRPGRKTASTNNLNAKKTGASQATAPPGWSTQEAQVAAGLMQVFQQAGFSKAGAAGMVGNAYQESSLNPSAAGGYLFQWTGSRLTALQSFANQAGKPVTDVQVQAMFAVHEIQSQYPSLLKFLYNTNDPAAAATQICNVWERPGTPDLANRVYRARQAFGITSWGTQGLSPGDAVFNQPGGGGSGGPFGSVLDLLNAPVDAIGGWLAQIALNLTKDVGVGLFDAIVVPFWHWNQRGVSAYADALFGSPDPNKSPTGQTARGGDQQWEMIMWNAAFWGFGYWLFFVDPDVKGINGLLKPGPVRKSRIARHTRFAQSIPARTKLIKPKEVSERTAKKPKPVVSYAPITRVDTMRTYRPERVKVTGNGRGSETGIRREGSIPVPKDDASATKHHAENGKPDAKHRAGSHSLQDRARAPRGASGSRR